MLLPAVQQALRVHHRQAHTKETAMSEQRYSLGRNEAVNPLTVKPQFSTKPVGAARCAAVRTPQRLAPYLSLSLRPGFRILR